jgi:hypothetical protein
MADDEPEPSDLEKELEENFGPGWRAMVPAWADNSWRPPEPGDLEAAAAAEAEQAVWRARRRQLRRQLVRHFQAAARGLEGAGWRIRGSSVAIQDGTGNWGAIILEHRYGEDPIEFALGSGVESAYLLRTLRERAPDRPPRGCWHAWLSAGRLIGYSDTPSRQRPPLIEIPEQPDGWTATWHSGPGQQIVGTLDPASAVDWFRDAMERLAPRLLALMPDAAIREWLLYGRNALHLSHVREAALLSRHLGLVDDIPAILAAAEREYHEEARRLGPQEWTDRSFQPMMWSHARFLRFLDQVEP